MSEEREFIGYVLFSRVVDDETKEETIVFAGEYTDMANAEERKADLNRTMPNELRGVTVCVGLAHHHDHEDEDKAFIKITPKDGSEPFLWGDMIDGAELVAYADSQENKDGKR